MQGENPWAKSVTRVRVDRSIRFLCSYQHRIGPFTFSLARIFSRPPVPLSLGRETAKIFSLALEQWNAPDEVCILFRYRALGMYLPTRGILLRWFNEQERRVRERER